MKNKIDINKEKNIKDIIINGKKHAKTDYYNETYALISSANKKNTDKLNYDEFKNLFENKKNN